MKDLQLEVLSRLSSLEGHAHSIPHLVLIEYLRVKDVSCLLLGVDGSLPDTLLFPFKQRYSILDHLKLRFFGLPASHHAHVITVDPIQTYRRPALG